MAISAALLVGAGFPVIDAACLALVANTAPVAFGAIGTPIMTLACFPHSVALASLVGLLV